EAKARCEVEGEESGEQKQKRSEMEGESGGKKKKKEVEKEEESAGLMEGVEELWVEVEGLWNMVFQEVKMARRMFGVVLGGLVGVVDGVRKELVAVQEGMGFKGPETEEEAEVEELVVERNPGDRV